MTLIASISRAHSYVIACGDTGSFLGFDDDAPFLGNSGGDSKSMALSENVLVLRGGCRAIGDDFLEFLGRAVSPGDDIDDCHRHAQAFVKWAEANDRPGEPYENPNVPGGWAARGSLHDNTQGPTFNFLLTGFRRDGSTRLVQYQSDFGFEAFEDPDVGEFGCGTPYGVPEYLAQTFFSIEAPSLHEAFENVWGLHHTLLRKCPDKVTRELRGIALHWRDGDTPERIILDCDVLDLDAYGRIREQLAALGPPPLTQFSGSIRKSAGHRTTVTALEGQLEVLGEPT